MQKQKILSFIGPFILTICSLILGSVLICSCSSDPSNLNFKDFNLSLSPPEDNIEQFAARANQHLKQAEGKNYPNSLSHRLIASENYIKAGRMDEAVQTLRDILNREPSMDPKYRTNIFEARYALLKQDNKRAITHIQMISKEIAKFNPEINVDELNTITAKTATMPSTTMPPTSDFIPTYTATTAPSKSAAPATSNATATLAAATAPTSHSAPVSDKKIALLLPSKGPHAAVAKTIRDGFLAANQKHDVKNVKNKSVNIYDTSSNGGVKAAYEQAISDHVDLVVGPLTKEDVQKIAKLDLSVPVLALNVIGETRQKNLYQFGLMPEDEVFSIVQHAHHQGKKRALVMIPENEWGSRVAQAFKYFFELHDGRVIDMVSFRPDEDLSNQIQKALTKERSIGGGWFGWLGGSEKSGQSEQALRKDIDMIFLAASPELGRTIMPLVNSVRTVHLPVYATASIYSGKPEPGKDQPLDGITFCDMPVILNRTNQLKNELQIAKKLIKGKLREEDHALPPSPYFALGMDAERLAHQLRESGIPSKGIAGLTGVLKLNKNHQIQRQLMCAKFERGVPVSD